LLLDAAEDFREVELSGVAGAGHEGIDQNRAGKQAGVEAREASGGKEGVGGRGRGGEFSCD
jgi:hypothetical protein